MKILLYWLVAIAALIFTFSCNKSSLVGSDLFTPNSIDVLFSENFDITAKTITTDSIVTYDGTSSISSLMIGTLTDPVFGERKAEAYIDLNRSSSVVPGFTYSQDGVRKKVVLDSVVLVLALRPEGFYGDTTLQHDIQVRIMDQKIPTDDTLYSSFKPAGEGTLIGNATLTPNYSDSLFIIEPGDSTATAYAQQLRITLDNSWAQAMIDDTTLIDTDDNFRAYAPGLHISSSSPGSSLWGINLNTSLTSPNNRILIYYTKEETPSIYEVIVNGLRHNYYEQNYAGFEIEPFLNNAEMGDSLLFVQGMAGPDIELNIPVLESNDYEEFLVNQAELEFFVLEDVATNLYPPIESIVLQYYNDDGQITAIEDAIIAAQTSGTVFDGMLSTKIVNGQTLKKYSAIMTIRTIGSFSGENTSSKIRIVPRNKSILPNRSIIYGPGHSKYPMKFKLNYSK